MLAPDLAAAKRSLLGTLVGDTLGLPYEGLSAKRGTRLLPFPLRQRLLFRHGMPSDDTVQSYLVLKALIQSHGSTTDFQRHLSQSLRVWFLSIPPGIGLSTIKACLRICVGLGLDRSGVRSAGNGAAMRSAVIGAYFASDDEGRTRFVAASTVVTHTDPLAVQGAQLIALAAALVASGEAEQFDSEARELCADWPWSAKWPDSGPTGYVVHSVNAVIDLWKRFGNEPARAMEGVIQLGGDTDSVGAMLGGILGAGSVEWPTEWTRTLGFPRVSDVRSIDEPGPDAGYVRLVAANLLALPPILLFGLRRLLPPY